MITSQKGIELIKQFEGLKLTAYRCSANVLTIGYGTTSGVYKGMEITKEQAEELLKKDLVKFEARVLALVNVNLTQNQFDSLVSFCYNIGHGALSASTLLKKLNKKDYAGASEEFVRWNKAGGKVLVGLTRRRMAEQKLFNT